MATPAVSGGTDGTTYSPEQLDELANRSKTEERNNKIIAWTKSAHARCRTLRMQIERQWYINLAFYSGRQNIAVVPVSTGSAAGMGIRLYVPPAPYYRSRPVINRIRPIVRKEWSKLTAQKPSATVIPSTSDQQDQSAAKAGEQIWESMYRRKKLHNIYGQAQMWARTTGLGYVKAYWDPTAYDPDNPEIPGDICYEVVSPFHVFVPDMLATDIEDQPYVIHVSTRTTEWVQLNFPDIPATPNVMEASDILNDSFLSLVGATDYRKNAIMCYEVWIKPGNVSFMPNGGMFWIIGDSVVEYQEGNPYIHQQYPFDKLDNIPNSRYYTDSVINDLVPIQKEYNRARGQITENRNKMGHFNLMAPKGGVTASKITTEPGQVIEYEVGFPPPTPLPLQQLPNYISEELNMQLLDFDDISGQHDVSKGQSPPGVTAATAINFLQEQDDTMLASSFQSAESFYEKLAFQTLNLIKQYWTAPRMVKVSGRNRQFDVIAFQGADLRSNTDIRIEAGSALPTSKAAKQALLMDLMSQQFISPEQGLELMDMGGTQELYEQLQIDTEQAMRENMKMSNVTPDLMQEYLETFQPQPQIDPMTGTPLPPDPNAAPFIDPSTGGPLVDATGMPTQPPLIVPVNSFDNHAAHINAHNNYRKSQEFDNLSPELKKLFEEHVNEHMAALGVPPGMPDPTTNQPPIPMDQTQDPSVANGMTSGEGQTSTGPTNASTPNVQANNSTGPMPPNGANMMGGVPNG